MFWNFLNVCPKKIEVKIQKKKNYLPKNFLTVWNLALWTITRKLWNRYMISVAIEILEWWWRKFPLTHKIFFWVLQTDDIMYVQHTNSSIEIFCLTWRHRYEILSNKNDDRGIGCQQTLNSKRCKIFFFVYIVLCDTRWIVKHTNFWSSKKKR